ncbi:MAG TPA: tetratricopeptide repeat protein [Rickettsia endosymbiont of Bembidion nr. Transversale]|nr:tetratricopeptide repeat protein [Rickettsia endosymbiont of Bembidion nr. Transversale]
MFKPDYAKSYNSKGYILEKHGRYEEAVREYKRVIELSQDFTKTVDAKAT